MRRFTRRRWLHFGVVACTLLAMGAYWLTRPRLSITEETCAKIRPGMMRADVEALIGRRPGDCTRWPVIWALGPRPIGFERGVYNVWINNQGQILVFWDCEGKVREASFDSVMVREGTPFEYVRYRLFW